MAGFKSAFRAARAAGSKSFMWNGEKYNTKLASDTPTPPKRPASLPSAPSKTSETKSSETKWSDPGAKEGGKPRDDREVTMKSNDPKDNLPKGETYMSDPNRRSAEEGSGWGDKWRASAGYKRGGMVKKAKGPATIGVTRSNRDYGKKR